MHRCYGDSSIAERFRISIDISVAGDPVGVFWMPEVTKWRNAKPVAGGSVAKGKTSDGDGWAIIPDRLFHSGATDSDAIWRIVPSAASPAAVGIAG